MKVGFDDAEDTKQQLLFAYLFDVFPESGLEKNCDSRSSISDLNKKR